MNQMKNMGRLESVLSMLPGVGGKVKDISSMVDEKPWEDGKPLSFL